MKCGRKRPMDTGTCALERRETARRNGFRPGPVCTRPGRGGAEIGPDGPNRAEARKTEARESLLTPFLDCTNGRARAGLSRFGPFRVDVLHGETLHLAPLDGATR